MYGFFSTTPNAIVIFGIFNLQSVGGNVTFNTTMLVLLFPECVSIVPDRATILYKKE